MEDPNVFAGAFVDRSGERRKDKNWLSEALFSPDARFVPVWGDRCLAGGDPPAAALLDRSTIGELIRHDNVVFLGLFRNQPAFAVAVDPASDAPFAGLGEFRDLRYLGTVLPPDEANLIAHARALVLWHSATLYCSKCGSAAHPDASGNMRRCSNPDCNQQIFPRTDPAIIVLVTHGDRCLLGRQQTWPEGRYSTIAGFVEPGESVEDAVRREVYEETNVRVGEVRYHSSQPWPFPSALMLGFVGDAISTDVRLNDGELEDARWFTRDELRSGEAGLPFRISIARRLVDYFLNGG
ncbi:MAG: NAD(+) diphosphatase [Woeseiaceae bacterium]